MWFFFREQEKEGEKEGEKHRFVAFPVCPKLTKPATQACALSRN